MTRRTIGSVMDDINEWSGPNGSVYYVTAFFTNKEVLSVGKKDMDAALEVRGLLQEVIEVPQEFILEPKGQSKSGLAKWNLKAFGPPEGVWTYNTIKGAASEVGAAVGSGPDAPGATHPSAIAPVPTNSVDASIRASVAAKAATTLFAGTGNQSAAIASAEGWDAWLAKKSGGTALPDQDEGAGQGEGLAPSSTTDGKWTERVKDWPDPGENPQ